MTNKELIKSFFKQDRAEGHNPGRSLYFIQGTLYSYGAHFPLAVITAPNEVTITTRKYSVTTSKHTSAVCYAASVAGYTITREEL